MPLIPPRDVGDLYLFYRITLYQGFIVAAPAREIRLVIGVRNDVRIFSVRFFLRLLFLFFFVVFIKLCFGETLGSFDFEANIASFFIATNPNGIATLVASFVLQNLISLYK
jgi:hypothetical protein